MFLRQYIFFSSTINKQQKEMKFSSKATLFLAIFVFSSLIVYSNGSSFNRNRLNPSAQSSPPLQSEDSKSPSSASSGNENNQPLKNADIKSQDHYTDQDFLAAAEYGSMKFQDCCNFYFPGGVNNECNQLVCKYGLDSDYMRSAIITKCNIDYGFITSYLYCANYYMDNYNCCRTLGISDECCNEYMSYYNVFREFNTDKFLSQCIDVLKAVSYCPVLHF